MTGKTCLAVSCFAGLPLVGLKRAGYEVPLHLGTSNYGISTSELNHPEARHTGSPDEWDELIEDADINPADMCMFAQPECAVWSAAGKSHGSLHGWKSDPRLNNFKSIVDLSLKLRPRFTFIESVPQAYRNGRELMVEFSERAADVGMSTTFLFVNAANHGVPQLRKRFFLVFHTGRFRVEPPELRRPTVREALEPITDPGHHSRMPERLLPYVEKCRARENPLIYWMRDNDPEDYEYHKNGHVVGRPRMMEARIPWDEPMGAYIGDFYIHPIEHRYVGVNEAKALCCVPQDYQLDGNPGGHASLLARSVMPPVAQWCGEQALTSWDEPIPNRPETHLIDTREGMSLFV